MRTAPIYVVMTSDDMCPSRRPEQEPNPIVFETVINGATLESAKARAARLERLGYGATRIGRVVFEDEPGFIPEEDAK